MKNRMDIVLSWSGGKDSALAFYELQTGGQYNIVSLLTTVSQEYERISHHGVRTELLDQQACEIDVPLRKVYLPSSCTNEVYETIMREVMVTYNNSGVRGVAFGDIFLQDLRRYREHNLEKIGIKGIFPIWERDTKELVQTFVEQGFKAYVSCVDGKKLDASFAGRTIDESFVRDLPEGVDPCGENGEFHSYVFDGPIFGKAVGVEVGEVVARDTRYFADLLPTGVCDKVPAGTDGL